MQAKWIKFWVVLFLLCTFASSYAQWSGENTQVLNLEVNKGDMLEVNQEIGTIFLADPSVVDYHLKAPGVLYLYAKKIGETSLFATDKAGKIIFKYTVRVTKNLAELNYLLRQIIPGHHITVLSSGDNIILRGSVKSIAMASDARRIAEKFAGDPTKVLSFLRVVAPTQVNLRVQVIEMDRSIIRSLGINWSANFNTPSFKVGLNPNFVPSDFSATGGGTVNGATLNGLLQNGNASIQAIVNILEQNGLVTVLSEPNLTALSGQTASFLVGGEFPIPVPQGQNGTVTILFKKFGVSLAFTPTILEDGKINLQVRPEVSQLTTQGAVTISGFQVPALSTRRADTTVELKSGQSFSIAGLLQNNANKMVQQMPGLGSLPVLGKLFRSQRFQRDETELLILVTPYIVAPAANQALAYPTTNANASVTASYSHLPRNQNVGFILD